MKSKEKRILKMVRKYDNIGDLNQFIIKQQSLVVSDGLETIHWIDCEFLDDDTIIEISTDKYHDFEESIIDLDENLKRRSRTKKRIQKRFAKKSKELPKCPVKKLTMKMERAVYDEKYEEAAVLKKQLESRKNNSNQSAHKKT